MMYSVLSVSEKFFERSASQKYFFNDVGIFAMSLFYHVPAAMNRPSLDWKFIPPAKDVDVKTKDAQEEVQEKPREKHNCKTHANRFPD